PASVLRACHQVDEALEDEGLPGLRPSEREMVAKAAAGGRVCVARLVARVLAGRQASAPRRADVQTDHWRWFALSRIAAIDAAAREDVRSFRAGVLADGLLPYKSGEPTIRRWVNTHRGAPDAPV